PLHKKNLLSLKQVSKTSLQWIQSKWITLLRQQSADLRTWGWCNKIVDSVPFEIDDEFVHQCLLMEVIQKTFDDVCSFRGSLNMKTISVDVIYGKKVDVEGEVRRKDSEFSVRCVREGELFYAVCDLWENRVEIPFRTSRNG